MVWLRPVPLSICSLSFFGGIVGAAFVRAILTIAIKEIGSRSTAMGVRRSE
jgi:hypothetical protein